MSEQDIQKQIEFIVQQQAQITTDLQVVTEAQTKAETRISNLEGAMVGLVNLFGELVKAQKGTDATVTDLSGGIEALTEKVNMLTGQVDTFLDTVKNYLNERNGSGRWN